MSVVAANEIHTGRTGGDESSPNKSSVRATRVYRVLTDTASDESSIVLAAVPQRGSVHPKNLSLFLKKRTARNESFSKLVWIVTLEYSLDREQSTNPLEESPVVTWDTETTSENITQDIDGEAVLNSAGDYYEDGVPVQVAYWTAKIEVKKAAIPLALLTYRNAINNDAFILDGVTIAAYEACFAGIHIGWWEQKNNVWFRQLNITLKFRGNWREQILDQGIYRLVEVDVGSYEKVKCVAEDGTDVTKPVLLDGSGGQLDNPSPSTAVFNTHSIRPELSFQTVLAFLYESY
jgi:hypothetical protein